ncbi:MAG TPA: hypothetical protein VF235_00475 [Actinomycetota bacterium]
MDDRERQSSGPPPTADAPDALAELEGWLEDRDRSFSEQHDPTAGAGRRGSTLDERLAEELPEVAAASPPQLVDVGGAAEDGLDDVAELVATSAGAPGRPAPEEAAMRIVDRAPGATDHPDDLVEPPLSED